MLQRNFFCLPQRKRKGVFGSHLFVDKMVQIYRKFVHHARLCRGHLCRHKYLDWCSHCDVTLCVYTKSEIDTRDAISHMQRFFHPAMSKTVFAPTPSDLVATISYRIIKDSPLFIPKLIRYLCLICRFGCTTARLV